MEKTDNTNGTWIILAAALGVIFVFAVVLSAIWMVVRVSVRRQSARVQAQQNRGAREHPSSIPRTEITERKEHEYWILAEDPNSNSPRHIQCSNHSMISLPDQSLWLLIKQSK